MKRDKKMFTIGLGSAILILLLVYVVVPVFTFAQEQTDSSYTLLAPIPCVGGDCNTLAEQTTLEKYLPGMFMLLIGLSAVAAIVMIVVGGFQYMTTDAIQNKQQGKERIKNAILGLVLVISAWLILNTINPKLTTLSLSMEPVEVGGPAATTPGAPTQPPSGPGVPMTLAEIEESNANRDYLEDNDVYTYKGPCTQGQTKGCVNLNSLPDSAKDGLVVLKDMCGNSCSVLITGGTEYGHATHGPNQPKIDLNPNPGLDAFVEKNKVGPPSPTKDGPLYTVVINGKPVTFLRESNHWHLSF